MNDSKPKPAGRSAAPEFTITRVFNAPLDRVWRAWTDREDMSKWWGPKGFTGEVVKLDFRPGGICHYRLVSPNGQEMWGKFVYREIVPHERLVYVGSFSDADENITVHPMSPGWPRQILSTITFSETDGKTTVTVHWTPYDATDEESDVFEAGAQSMQGGWTGTLDRLADYLARA